MITGQLKRIFELQSPDSEWNKSKNNICAVVSGKGGTGKTVFSIYLSDLLVNRNRKILLIDLDINLANIHFLLNQTPAKSLNNYFSENETLQNLITEYADNFHIIYGLNSYSIKDFPLKSSLERLIRDIDLLSENYDLVILDLGAGLSEFTLNALKISGIKIIVSYPEATSVMDAYAVIKMYENFDAPSEFQLVMNRCLDKNDGVEGFNKLSKAVQSFLRSSVKLLSTISESNEIRQSVAGQTLLDEANSDSNFISELMVAAEKIDKYIHLTNINQPSKSSSFSPSKNNSKSSIIL
ncbi:Flagellar biosynthesis protein FlhG [Ignavibacterium album JCM 16511]|uniref:Flagellar biosynthesis protein FlhG n=1 Tax=Ignavibacterium album (strain DSM 19864 / JCM 16511 / NBRC 101810 / Mat9-16) TaxID=945713 RepID=I0AML9_IGNAJ|nr:AAA family ATPase [Ignavibacterium album]AFH50226.1 Flagellar biosynthesis protein FlhG [Ignavibacterium album JCM 16511]